jgi:ATP-dependent helicase HrpB
MEQGKVLIVEPRRLACRSLAGYVAKLADTPLGQKVGYAVRFDNQSTAETQALFVTPGIALRWLADGKLNDFDTVILDEFHERRWDTDLFLALLRARQYDHTAGPAIRAQRLVVTSATLEGKRLATYLDAEYLKAEGKLFPVEVRYTEQRELPRLKQIEERVKGAIDAVYPDTQGDILVFLPGKGEIHAVQKALSSHPHAEVIPLHAGADNQTQDKALSIARHRRIILSTNVAETSLTIPGVKVVVDSGLERRTHHRNARTVLGLHCVSQASADQRRGRAGRTAPGLCLRLWGKQARLEPFTPPEIEREELTELLLAAAAAGASVGDLRFPNPLPEHAVQRAQTMLKKMHAIDAQGRITEHGKRLFPLPLDPLFAHLITAMPNEQTKCAMADLAAALSVSRPLIKPTQDPQVGEALQEWIGLTCDALTQIQLIRSDPPKPIPVNRPALQEARKIAGHTRKMLGIQTQGDQTPIPRNELLSAVAKASPELVYVQRRKREALGNEYSEVLVGKESYVPGNVRAAVVFDQHHVPGKGMNQTINMGTCLASVSFAQLAAWEMGHIEDRQPQWTNGQVQVQRERIYAGRTIHSETIVPQKSALRHALTRLILDNTLMKPAGETLLKDVAAWNLYIDLKIDEGDQVDAETWLVSRLESLGVVEQEDLELINAEDLRFEGIPPWERERFDRLYPRTVQLSNLHMQVHYEAGKKRITLEKTSGRRKNPPQRKELPAWQGWRIRFRDASRVVELP